MNHLHSVISSTEPRTQKYALGNGLEIILCEDHRTPLIAVDICYHVGAGNDPQGKAGLAHFVEHLMFEGSKHVKSGEYFKHLLSRGATDVNGGTRRDRTNYMETVPANELELALWLESDRMGFLYAGLTSEILEGQRAVIGNERCEAENRPYYLMEEELSRRLFPAGHPYHASIIGSHEEISGLSAADVESFLGRYYSPSNASIALVGDFRLDDAHEKVEKYFSSLPALPAPLRVTAPVATITAETYSEVTDNIQLPCICMAWIVDPIFSLADAKAELLATVLGAGILGRLYRSLVHEKQVASAIQVQDVRMGQCSVFQIRALAAVGVTSERLIRALDESLIRFLDAGPTEEEVERARAVMFTQRVMERERAGGFGGCADLLNCYEHYLGNPFFWCQDLDRLSAVHGAAIREYARKNLSPDRRVVVQCLPGKRVLSPPSASRDAAAAPALERKIAVEETESWRSNPPASRPFRSFDHAIVAPERFQLANGLTVLVDHRSDAPLVSANLVAVAGSEADQPELAGLASFTAEMLEYGSVARPALALAEECASLGAALQTWCTVDSAGAGMHILPHNLDAALAVLVDVTINPAMDAATIEKVQKRRAGELVGILHDPSEGAGIAFLQALLGRGHPLAHSELGREASILAMDRSRVMDFWGKFYVPQNMALIISGNCEPQRARAFAEKHLGQWRAPSDGRIVTSAPAIASPGLHIIDRAGLSQSFVYVGGIGVSRASAEFPSMEIANLILCGLFTSRLTSYLRSMRGYTYAIESMFSYHRSLGFFGARGAVHTEAAAQVVAEIVGQFEDLGITGASREEISLVREFMLLSLASRFQTSVQRAACLENIFIHGLPTDHYRTLVDRIRAITPGDIQAVAMKYMQRPSIAAVIMGERSALEPQFQEPNLPIRSPGLAPP